MDPITQIALGGIAGSAALGSRLGRIAFAAGALGGLLPDADVLLEPFSDPALPFEWHRHFTHSLAFVPVGGFIAAAPFALSKALRPKFWSVYAAATVGWLTHGPLDTCTSYGTHLGWPFVAGRSAWDSMPIIDPIFTGMLIVAAIAFFRRGTVRWARTGLTIALLYIGLGFVQHARAKGIQEALAHARGHACTHGRVTPTIGNLVLWRSVYATEDDLVADAIRIVPWRRAQVRVGTAHPRFCRDELHGHLPDPVDVRRAEVFMEFADDFVGNIAPSNVGFLMLGDLRYSLATGAFEPLWGLRVQSGGLNPLTFVSPDGRRDDAPEFARRLWFDIIRGDDFQTAEEAVEEESRR